MLTINAFMAAVDGNKKIQSDKNLGKFFLPFYAFNYCSLSVLSEALGAARVSPEGKLLNIEKINI